jgi:3D (Asp-Asp-Asp) domain-containing protein
MRVRLTFYSGLDDQYGSRVAWRKVREAKRGRTAAADPSVLPFGTWIHIPGLGKLRIEDTGSAVKAKTASRGTVPVIDVYVGNDQDARRLSRTMPDYVEITLHDPGPQKL